jgi:hypothetical protein
MALTDLIQYLAQLLLPEEAAQGKQAVAVEVHPGIVPLVLEQLIKVSVEVVVLAGLLKSEAAVVVAEPVLLEAMLQQMFQEMAVAA